MNSTDRSSGPTRKRKVAVLGGGCGGLAAAWELTQPRNRGAFDVTVYQMGWRLGGKGASGRAPFAGGNRIEEHGLHLWFGFYLHSFTLLAQAYREAGIAGDGDWWQDAFEKCDGVTLYEGDGDRRAREFRLPSRDGGPPDGGRRPRFARALATAIRLVSGGVRGALRDDPDMEALQTLDDLEGDANGLDALAREPDAIPLPDDWVPLKDSPIPWLVTPRENNRGMEAPARNEAERTAGLVDAAADKLGRLRDQLRDWHRDIRFWVQTVELTWATFRGTLGNEILWNGLGSIDHQDLREWLREWLRECGASEDAANDSPMVRALYDLTFAYEGGDKSKPSLAAGKGLQALLMMINYQGAFMWRMKAGMGDVVFAPLYLGLKKRGVKFQFFSRVTELEPRGDLVERIRLDRQARVTAGVDRYEPLEEVCGRQCWPSLPFWNQLDGPDRTVDFERDDESRWTVELERGSDFDDVVLAIPVGALEGICRPLEANDRFKAMLDNSRTVATKALQVWLTEKPSSLAVTTRTGLAPPATGYSEPFDTYCDMSHLIPPECYGSAAPSGIAYFCACLADGSYSSPADAHDVVGVAAGNHLEHNMRGIWTRAYDAAGLKWDLLFDPTPDKGKARLGAQFWRANVTGTERYVQTPPGSPVHRLRPDQSGFGNVVLAGDWTRNVIDGGCVEAAVTSGVSAGRSLNPLPPYVDYGALASSPGPLESREARLYCFWLEAERNRLQELLDRVFKEPTRGAWRYRPMFSRVILTFGVLEGLQSLHPGFQGRGALREEEVGIWIPTVAEKRRDGDYVPDHLAIFMPYVFVDDGIALSSGREVYGFAKSQGTVSSNGSDWPPAAPLPHAPRDLELHVRGGPRTSTTLTDELLLKVTCQKPSNKDPRTGLEEFLKDLRKHGGDIVDAARQLPPAIATAKELIDGHIRLVFLKQIRDAAHGDRAALSQLVEARGTVLKDPPLRWRRFSLPFTAAIEDLPSHPLISELGLQKQQSDARGFAVQFSFRIGAGEIRWP